jgi:hypothetical protein
MSYVCQLVEYPAVAVSVRDASGAGRALGTRVVVRGYELYPATTEWDTLTIYGFRGVDYVDVTVSKPGYRDTTVRDVYVPHGRCGRSGTAWLSVTLSLSPDAPHVRSFHLLPSALTLDRRPGRDTVRLLPVIDAAPAVPRTLLWRLVGDTSSVNFDPQAGVLRYRCRDRATYFSAVGILAADTTFRDTVVVAVQGHPAATNDPPC